MTTVFGRDYADVYDAIYRGKDYDGEAELIERILARYGTRRPCRLLDIGCGTGRHAFVLARRGYHVTGVDRSPFMLGHAKAAADAAFGTEYQGLRFLEADARTFDVGERFEGALMMFTVLGYQQEQSDVSAALDTVHKHLAPGGLFIFDVWNGLAVLAQAPQPRTVSATEGAAKIVRTSSTRVDAERQLCHVHFDISRTERGCASRNWVEDHTLRYFLPAELEAALNRSRLRLLDLRRFPDGEGPPDERAWNVIGVAQVQ